MIDFREKMLFHSDGCSVSHEKAESGFPARSGHGAARAERSGIPRPRPSGSAERIGLARSCAKGRGARQKLQGRGSTEAVPEPETTRWGSLAIVCLDAGSGHKE